MTAPWRVAAPGAKSGPTRALTERSDVGHMVAAVPSIGGEVGIETQRADLWMSEGTGEIGIRERLEHRDPTAVKTLE